VRTRTRTRATVRGAVVIVTAAALWLGDAQAQTPQKAAPTIAAPGATKRAKTDSYGGLSWGASVADLDAKLQREGRTLKAQDPALRNTGREVELLVGTIPVTEDYKFEDGKLTMVSWQFPSVVFGALVEVLTTKYGPPTLTKARPGSMEAQFRLNLREWVGTGHPDVSIMEEPFPSTGMAFFQPAGSKAAEGRATAEKAKKATKSF